MRIRILRAFVMLISTVCFTITTQQAKASHAMGADLSFQCIDSANLVYKVTYNFYRDCAGITPGTTVELDIQSVTCGQMFSAVMNIDPLSLDPDTNKQKNGLQGIEVSPLCRTLLHNSSCNGGTYPGVEKYVYNAIVTLPQTCVDWTFSVFISARNIAITNLNVSSGPALYVQAVLNNVAAPTDHSPVFTTLPVPYFCENNPFFYNQGGVDADGDSLVFSSINPLDQGAIPIPYVAPFSPTNPLSTSTGFSFDSLTGQMSFTPNATQNAVVAILVQEYRNGQLIGSTMRDVQLTVLNIPGCSNPPTPFTGVNKSSVQNGFYITPINVQTCPGSTLSFNVPIKGLASDSIFINDTTFVGIDTVYLESNINQSIPGATFTVARYSADSVIGSFNWVTTRNDTGAHTFVVIVRDNHCPISNNQAYAITISVLRGAQAGPDRYFCPSGGALQLNVTGGTRFTWTPSTGLNNDTIPNPLATPKQTTTYIVTTNLDANCKNTDTVIVYRVPDFNLRIAQSKTTICLNDLVTFNTITDSAFAPYSYVWSPSGSLNANNIGNPYAQPAQTTTYQLIVTSDSTGCTRKDSATVTVQGIGPKVTLAADKNGVCVGDTIQLTSFISTVQCGLSTAPCAGPIVLKTMGTDSINQFDTPTPFQAFSEAGRIQMLFSADELHAQGIITGAIQSIAFNVSVLGNASGFVYHNFNIRMGCTDEKLTTGFVSGLSQVYFSQSSTTLQLGWNTYSFPTAYNWDGVSNLLVEVCYTNSGFNNNNDQVFASNTSFNSVVYAAQDGQIGCNLNAQITPIHIASTRPNVQFTLCPAPPPNVTHTWSPLTNILTPDSTDTKVVLSNTTTYFLTANDGTCDGAAGITLTIDNSFGVDAGPDLPLCNGVPVQLQASLTGVTPLKDISCGVNGTICSQAPVQKTINLPGMSVSPHTMFPGDTGTFADSRTQIMYTTNYLLNAGITKGTISQIGFFIYQKNSSRAFQNLNIKIGCSSKNKLDDNSWEPTSQVYNSSSYNTVNGWNDFILQSPYDWDGVSNLVVEFCWSNPDSLPQLGADYLSSQTTNYVAFHTNALKGIPGCSIGTPTQQFYTEIPLMRLQYCPPPPLTVTYVWSPKSFLSNDSILQPVASPTQPTTYTITAQYGTKCAKTDAMTVTPATVVPAAFSDTTICAGGSAQLLATGGNTYAWNGNGLSCTSCPNPIATPDASSTYTVTVSDAASGCNGQASVVVTLVDKVTLTPPLVTDTVSNGKPAIITVAATGGNGTYFYTWLPDSGLTFPNMIAMDTAITTPLTDITYRIIVSSGPCVDTAIADIHVLDIDSMAIPNAFTPNGDGHDDYFYPVFINKGVTVMKEFRIYNRYGQLIYDNVSTPGWDGKFKGAEQPVGTYVYYISAQVQGEKERHIQGAVTLLR